MVEKIGCAAGQIWQFMANNKEPVTLSTLPKKVGINAQLTQMALGWLAREGKVRFHEKGKGFLVSLVVG